MGSTPTSLEQAAPPPMAVNPQPGGGGGAKAVFFVLAGLLVAGAAVVLVLGFAAGPKWFVESGGKGAVGTAANEQEKVVAEMLQAMEEKNVDAFIDAVSPSFVKEMEEVMAEIGEGGAGAFVKEYLFGSYESLEYEDIAYRTDASGDMATVEVFQGTATLVENNGEVITDNAADSGPYVYVLVKTGGAWYVDFDSSDFFVPSCST